MTGNALKRHAVGVFSVLLLISGLSLYFWGSSDNNTRMLAAACLRVGAVLAATWIAFRQVSVLFARVPPWMMGLMGVGILTVVARPRTALYVVPGLILLYFLRPRVRKSAASSESRSGSARRSKAHERDPSYRR
jgi:hypothetical protein